MQIYTVPDHTERSKEFGIWAHKHRFKNGQIVKMLAFIKILNSMIINHKVKEKDFMGDL